MTGPFLLAVTVNTAVAVLIYFAARHVPPPRLLFALIVAAMVFDLGVYLASLVLVVVGLALLAVAVGAIVLWRPPVGADHVADLLAAVPAAPSSPVVEPDEVIPPPADLELDGRVDVLEDAVRKLAEDVTTLGSVVAEATDLTAQRLTELSAQVAGIARGAS